MASGRRVQLQPYDCNWHRFHAGNLNRLIANAETIFSTVQDYNHRKNSNALNYFHVIFLGTFGLD